MIWLERRGPHDGAGRDEEKRENDPRALGKSGEGRDPAPNQYENHAGTEVRLEHGEYGIDRRGDTSDQKRHPCQATPPAFCVKGGEIDRERHFGDLDRLEGKDADTEPSLRTVYFHAEDENAQEQRRADEVEDQSVCPQMTIIEQGQQNDQQATDERGHKLFLEQEHVRRFLRNAYAVNRD